MKEKKAVSVETYVFLVVTAIVIGYLSYEMGVSNFFNTLMNTSHDLLLNTVFFIMAISVITGAFSSLLAEFGVISLLNKLISPLMRPVYGLPGAASLGIITTFISDNPAILSLAKNNSFIKYFKEYQIPALCNLGTSYGMGLILAAFMMGLAVPGIFSATLIGILGAVLGSVVSVRLMLRATKKYHGVSREESRADRSFKSDRFSADAETRTVTGSVMERVFNATLEGGKTGVQLGLDIIPGVLTICTLVMLMTFGPKETINGVNVYSGAAYEGIGLLPKLGGYIAPLMNLLFGFKHPVNLAFPITSMGSTGAAMGLIPKMLQDGTAGLNEIAVFTAIGMCWSGYLSTHISMMDSLNKRHFIKNAILSHTIGGIFAGVAAHYIYLLFSMIK